ncbi:YgfZ/GcvT domain-containing protein [uncultured Amnibacterium sp.]|uniref:CAF17-like 4Fe-4S cluster assembly/insertion protein YgfZ n=1 Tax=uncultured Amnibacterium sp. TaxID=1631851 RepID=UPI0035CA0783
MTAAPEPSPLLGLPGAVAGRDADAGVAAHYGDPVREQRTIAAADAVVDLSHRGVIAVTGADRGSWLDSLLSQRLGHLAPGEAAEALLLDPAGRVEHAAAIVDDGTTTWLVVEGGEATAFTSFLDRMRFMLRVEVADRTADTAVLGAFGPVAALDAVRPLIWLDPWATGSAGGATAARGEHPGAEWSFRLLLLPRTALAQVADLARAGRVRVAGTTALESLRIAAWRPRFAAEVDERTIPHELDWLRSAVHLNKGCYRGQETVAKVFNLGRPPRRLVQLDLDGSEGVLPEPGAPVLLGETQVGRVTSAAIHHEQGPIALAVIKRSVPADAALTVQATDALVAAAQIAIVPSDAGPAVAVPRLPRLGVVSR